MKKYNKIKKILFTAICGGLFIACQQPHNVNDPLQVLCLGNSIIKTSDKRRYRMVFRLGYGCFQYRIWLLPSLEKMLCKYHPNSTVTPLNIASWERNLSCDIDSLIGSLLQKQRYHYYTFRWKCTRCYHFSRCNFTTCEILSEQSKACYYYRLFLEKRQ